MDYRSDGLRNVLSAIVQSRCVHLHVSHPVLQFLWVICCRLLGKRVVLTLHGNYGRFNAFKNFLVRCSIRMSTVPIVINQQSFNACKRLNKRLIHISAFLPPQKEETLDADIVALVSRLHEQGKYIVSTNAFNVALDNHGHDMYGIDFLIDFFRGQQHYALLVSDPSGNYHKRYAQVCEGVHFISRPHSYYELLKHVDCFVRNTPTDGDALSVREALYLGIPALCTDAVDRPEGVQLFRYSDAASFTACLEHLQTPSRQLENDAEKIVQIYNNLL
jgi:glycosyltransferase involved in cell wall biosynthesis